MKSLVALLFICLFLPKAASGQLSCYTCNPAKCDEYVEQTCPSGSNSCFAASATLFDKKFILKSCGTKQICDGSQSLLPGAAFEDVKCCQENLCNGAEKFTLSFLLMFVPLLFSILFY